MPLTRPRNRSADLSPHSGEREAHVLLARALVKLWKGCLLNSWPARTESHRLLRAVRDDGPRSGGEFAMTAARLAISAITGAHLPRPLARIGAALAAMLRDAARHLFDPYHPELHYMRGPGPKWRAKHGGRAPTA
jgi:hypothetical protein